MRLIPWRAFYGGCRRRERINLDADIVTVVRRFEREASDKDYVTLVGAAANHADSGIARLRQRVERALEVRGEGIAIVCPSPHRVRSVCAQNIEATDYLPICVTKNMEERADGQTAHDELSPRSRPLLDRLSLKKTNRMKGLVRKFSVAPMMDWGD